MFDSRIASCALLLCSLATAQAVPITPSQKPRDLPSDASFRNGMIEKIAVGDFDRDLVQDLAYIRDGELFVASDPEVWAWYSSSGETGVSDITVLDSHNEWFPDIILAVGPNGTRLMTTEGNAWRVVPMADWSTIRRVRSYSTSGVHYLAGVDDNDVLHLGTWQAGLPIQTAAMITTSGILDFEFVDWDNDGTKDVVSRDASGLTAYDFAGVQIGSFPDPTPTTRGSITRVVADTIDQLAWMAWSQEDLTWYLRVLQNGAQTNSIALDFGAEIPKDAAAINIDAGDCDGDGYEDLLYYQATTSWAAVFRHDGTAAAYEMDDCGIIEGSPRDEFIDRAPALLHDINNDHHLNDDGTTTSLTADIVLPVQSSERFEIFYGLRSPLMTLDPQPQPSSSGGGGNCNSGPGLDLDYPTIMTVDPRLGQFSNQTLQMTIEVPAEFGFCENIEISAWRQDDPTTSDDVIFVDFENPARSSTTGATEVTIQLPHPTHSAINWTRDEVYFLTIRFVAYTSSYNVEKSSPYYLFALTADQDQMQTQAQLLDHYIRGISDCDESTEQSVTINRHIGAVKKRNLIPPRQLGLPGA